MPLIEQIEEKILEGIRSSCNDTFLFLEDESQKIGAEYLLTVNVAKKLADLNQYIGHPYKIYLERKTRLIASDCVPLFGREVANNFLGHRQVLRKQHNTSRNGKADITLYNNTDGLVGTPICVIELKGFDPSRTLVLQDLRRNSEYFKLVCRTGANNFNIPASRLCTRFRSQSLMIKLKPTCLACERNIIVGKRKLGSL